MPQSSQNAEEGAFSAPHFGQRLESGLPQAAQNFLPVVLSVPHFAQRMSPPERKTRLGPLVSSSLGRGQLACELQLDPGRYGSVQRGSYHKFAGA